MSAPQTAGQASPLTRLRQSWQAISPRERKLLLMAAAVVGVGIVLSTLDWSRNERIRLGRALPRAEAQLERVQESATEITRLRAQPAPQRPAAAALLDMAQTSARSRGLGVSIQAGGEGLHVKGQASFDELVAWLAAVQHDQGLRVLRMELQQQGALASIDALLAIPAAP
jgi:type II secretory pathway component PulM